MLPGQLAAMKSKNCVLFQLKFYFISSNKDFLFIVLFCLFVCLFLFVVFSLIFLVLFIYFYKNKNK